MYDLHTCFWDKLVHEEPQKHQRKYRKLQIYTMLS